MGRSVEAVRIQVGFKLLALITEKNGDEFNALMKKLTRRHEARMRLALLPEEEQNPMDMGSASEQAEEEIAELVVSSPDIDPRWLIAASIIGEMKRGNFPPAIIEKIEDAIEKMIAITR